MSFSTQVGRGVVPHEVIEDFGAAYDDGEWELRIRLVSWNGKPEKYDIRKWSKKEPDRCGKGLTLTGEEIVALTDALVMIRDT